MSENLRYLRERKGLTAEQASKELKIPFNFIKTMEEGAWHKLNQDIYTKKYLNIYLNFLGEEATGLAPFLFGSFSKNENQNVVTKGDFAEKKLKKGGSVIVPYFFRKIGIFVVVFLFFVYLSWQFYNFFRPPKLEIFFPADETIVYAPLLEVWGRTEKETPLYINGVEVIIAADGSFKEEIGLQKGTNIIKIEAVKKYGGRSTIFKEVLFE